MPLPVRDWQFWTATVLAGAALFAVLRAIVPADLVPKRFRRKDKGRRATLTVGGKPVGGSPDRRE